MKRKVILALVVLLLLGGVAYAAQTIFLLCYQGTSGSCSVISVANPLPVVAE